MGKTFVAKFGCQSLVLFLVIVPYIYILNFSIFPWMTSPESYASGVIHSFFSTLFTILILVSYYLCSTTSPGEFQDTLSPSYYLIYPIQDQDEKRFCNKCGELKPERAHHCSICKKCVLRMDHHCIWIGNCVGVFNHKYFVLFLLYSSVSILYFFILLIARATQVLSFHADESTIPNIDFSHIVISGLLVIVMVLTEISISSLLCTQIILLCRNMTTIEQEDIRRKSIKKLSNQATPVKKYDKGNVLNNLASVFGDFSIAWFLPVPPTILKINNNKKGDIFEV